MAVEGLPEGLVSNKEGVQPAEEGQDRVEAAQVAYLWRVYAAKKTVLIDNIGRRLENFFWRIWGNERLRLRLSGTQVNILFDIINEGGFLRTTPTSSPRSSKSINSYYKQARMRTPPTTPPSTEVPSEGALFIKARPSSNEEGTSDHTTSSPIPQPLPQIESLRQPKPLSSHGDVGDGSFTPTPTSPLAAIQESRISMGHSSTNDSKDSSITPTPPSALAALETLSKHSKENKRTATSSTRRPPILKKESSGSSRSSTTASLAYPSYEGPQSGLAAENKGAVPLDAESGILKGTTPSLPRRQTATRFNEEVAVSIPNPSTSAPRSSGGRMARSGLESNQKPGKRNPLIVANTAAGRTRPTFSRQRSSTAFSKEVPSRNSSSQNLARSPKLPSAVSPAESQPRLTSKQSPEPPSTGRSRAASPHVFKQRKRPSPDLLSSEDLSEESNSAEVEGRIGSQRSEDLSEGPVSEQPKSSKPLADLDFRTKLIDRTQVSQCSLTDIAAFARKSSAVVPTAASFQASGILESSQPPTSTGKGKGREAFTNTTAALKAPAPAGPGTADDSEAADDQNVQPFPRTKSQLTLLLEKEKTGSASEDRRARRTEL